MIGLCCWLAASRWKAHPLSYRGRRKNNIKQFEEGYVMTNFSQSYWVHHVQTMHGDLIEVNWSWFRKDRKKRIVCWVDPVAIWRRRCQFKVKWLLIPSLWWTNNLIASSQRRLAQEPCMFFGGGPWVFMIFRGEKVDATKTHKESKRIQKDHEDTLTYAKCVMVMSLQHIATISEVQGSKLVYFMISSCFFLVASHASAHLHPFKGAFASWASSSRWKRGYLEK